MAVNDTVEDCDLPKALVTQQATRRKMTSSFFILDHLSVPYNTQHTPMIRLHGILQTHTWFDCYAAQTELIRNGIPFGKCPAEHRHIIYGETNNIFWAYAK